MADTKFNSSSDNSSDFILLGAGGGWTWEYHNILLLPPSIDIYIRTYTQEKVVPIPESDNPEFMKLFTLGTDSGAGNSFSDYIKMLDDSNFWDMDLKIPDTIQYGYLIARSDNKENSIVWSIDSPPKELKQIVHKIIKLIQGGFENIYGIVRG